MARGKDTSRHGNRRPKIVDLNHFRQTGEVKDVRELNLQQRTEAVTEGNSRTNHPTNRSRKVYDYVEEEKRAAARENKVSEDTDPTPYKGTPRPKAAKDYPEEADFIDRNPANKTMIEKMYDKFEKHVNDWKDQRYFNKNKDE